ncbi:PREDICTED: uncharacterized protein LOC104825732 [Tarenaya hassleriana]|uniref:uncharacterized protein LOC104825732 n=1 Tax=Tarenaya hassleriana TaxID=28532 RepID=UPI00053C958A|nr:PREDICTED: uncharacterized protein LOC104825732 [Tarenaya hassleriana]
MEERDDLSDDQSEEQSSYEECDSVENNNVDDNNDSCWHDDEGIDDQLFQVDEMRQNQDNVIDEDYVNDDGYPSTPMNTEDEWNHFDIDMKQEKGSIIEPSKVTELCVGKMFNSGADVKAALLQYVLSKKFNVKLDRSESKKLIAVCTHEGCQWRIYCSVDVTLDKWVIKTYYPHHSHIPNGKAKMLKMRQIANMFVDKLRRNPGYTAADIQYDLQTEYNLTVRKTICYKARRIGLGIVMEDQKVQFGKLWDYEAELHRSNPNITTEICTKTERGNEVFDKFYICFEVLREAWKQYCRPVIGLDGCFSRWSLKGELLTAVGMDGNNRIYPISKESFSYSRTEGEDKSFDMRSLKILNRSRVYRNRFSEPV